MPYLKRTIDHVLLEWKNAGARKPLLIRGARQVGKSTAVRVLGTHFDTYLEVNFERDDAVKDFFSGNLDVKKITSNLSAYYNVPVLPGKTLVFLDEIQACPRAIEALRFYKEDYPELHVIAAGSLLEFVMEELTSFGVGRVRSLFMFPLSFDEFLTATGNEALLEKKMSSSCTAPLEAPFHSKLCELFRTYLLIGGMPEAVATWVETQRYDAVTQILDDIIVSYEDDFSKYKKRMDPALLRQCVRAVVHQIGGKFVYAKVGKEYRGEQVKAALSLLSKAGMIVPVTHSAANGLPIGAEEDPRYQKYIYLDTGLLLRILQMSDQVRGEEMVRHVLSAAARDLVNKGAIAEMAAGLELLRYGNPTVRGELHYWVRTEKNSVAEVDYVIAKDGMIVPIEVKAGVRGGMKSLYYFMEQKNTPRAIRLSLESFNTMTHNERLIEIVPLYGISSIMNDYS